MLNAIIDGKILGLASDQNANIKVLIHYFLISKFLYQRNWLFSFKTKIPIVVGFL